MLKQLRIHLHFKVHSDVSPQTEEIPVSLAVYLCGEEEKKGLP